MNIATGAMNTLLPKLGELLVGEYKLQNGVKGEIEELEKELKGMTTALHKVATMPSDQLDEQVKIWASDVRELSYDIEDAVDTFMLKSKRDEPATSFKKITNLFNKLKTKHQIHGVIKDIMDQVKKVSERRDRCRVDDITARTTVVDVDPRLEAMYRKATELIGISKPKHELTKHLLEYDSSSKKQSNIISIVGFGGLGKTTLANSLFQELKAKFDSHCFVSVSLNPDINKILKNILLQLDEKMYSHIDEAWETKQLIDKIRDFLNNRRFLCVIDDVWKESAWDTIKLAVQDAKLGSKIIITTRNKVVAEHAGGGVYEMKPLSDDDSRHLFYKRIFDSNDDCPADLCGVTEKILKKCGGVPLAIITTACLLASKPRNSQEWDKVNKSISFGLENSLDVDNMRKILSLSYNDLPFHLKTCLLSLSKYPEDELISKDVLIWSWLAEGFITEETRPAGMSLQEIGESYFSELINRSLIQPMGHDDRWEDGNVHACKVHDMVLELINQLSAEEDFGTTYLSDGKCTCTAHKKIRRLSLHNSNKSYASPEAKEQLSKVRSLTVFGMVDSIPPLSCFHVLRVLQLEDCSGLGKNHLDDLCKLHHLRFLRLGHYSATELPKSIGELVSLETLDIRGAEVKVLFPMCFVKLRKLVRLFADCVELVQGLMLGDMKSLQELAVVATPEVIKDIGNLKDLRTLKINFSRTLEITESIQIFLPRLTNLQDLEMDGFDYSTTLADMQQIPSGLQRFVCYLNMETFPSWINSSMLPCLTTLCICLRFEYLQPHQLDRLAELPSLRFLLLDCSNHSLRLQKLTIHRGACAFRSLKHFHFFSVSMMPSFQPGAMPHLERLYLEIRADLKRSDLNDLGLENLHSLRYVTIYSYVEENKAVVTEALKDYPNQSALELFCKSSLSTEAKMNIATGAMNTLLPKLGELLVGEYKLQKGIKGEIEELEKELTSMTAALHKVSDTPADQLDKQVKIWASDMRELSYDIEDAVDTFMFKSKRDEPATSFKKVTNLFNKFKTNHQIHGVIKDIMDQVKKVSERRDRCRVDDVAARPTVVDVDPRLEAMYRKATELVGISRPKDELTKQLLEHDTSSRQQSNIISIVGFGGLGKTTLANSLLHELKANFHCRFFVSVSLNPDINKIFKNILLQLDEKKYAHIDEAWDTKQLIDKIRDFLNNRRFLCVIDDVWKESAWDTIKLAVQDAKLGSKIIVTTRNKGVAEYAGGDIYEMKPLSDDDSRHLFYKRIFDSNDDCPADLCGVTEKILKKCGGVPLAIITTACLLASKPRNSQEWDKVNKSISFGLEDSLDVGRMRKILSLSYNDLPFHLKTCLLSLSKYPEDELIRKDVLIWSWLAEGFITEETQPAGTSLQEIGESYFSELINRSLIQPMDRSCYLEDEKVDVCKVHDMVLELINQLSAEEDFVRTYLSDGQQAGKRTCTAQKMKIRGLSLHNSNKSYTSQEEREQLSKVRSLTVFGKAIPPLSSFHVLRVLQLEDCSGMDKNHLKDLGKLLLLRFLRLGHYSATKLPESIGKLESLETLDIRGASKSYLVKSHKVMFPMSFVKLRKLVRLFAGRVKLAQGMMLRDMKSLQELEVDATLEVIEEIGYLKELRTLRIFFRRIKTLELVKSIQTSIQRLTNLQDLDMRFLGAPIDIQQIPSGLQRLFLLGLHMEVFPSWINSSMLSRLTTLSIRLTFEYLQPDHLDRLAELPSLRFLRLNFPTVSKGRQQKLTIHRGACAFRSLNHFHFYSNSMMPSFQLGAMPHLERLYFIIRIHLVRGDLNDFGLENLHSLRHVTICSSGEENKAVVEEALKDYPNQAAIELL
uniref:AAA+ ATPase domain-containing protein n=1 Tax=Oryza punctata TaxID=4537 RepID=A0A0E0MNE4_ORYPU